MRFFDNKEVGDLDIETLKTFITLANLANFSKTAEQHRVVQSTVTNRIKELENEVGKPLFLRDRKSVTLTNAGQHLLQYAQKIVALKETAAAELSMLGAYAAILRIGSVHTLYDCHLHNYISAYMDRHKDVAVKVVLDHAGKLLQHLHDDIIDICFCYRAVTSSQFLCLPFELDEFILVTGGNNDTYPQGIESSELKNLTMLFSDLITIVPQSWFSAVFPKYYTFPLEIDVGSKLIPFLEDGRGYCLLPRSAVRKELASGSLVEISVLDAPLPQAQSYLVLNRKSTKLKAVQNWFALTGKGHCAREEAIGGGAVT